MPKYVWTASGDSARLIVQGEPMNISPYLESIDSMTVFLPNWKGQLMNYSTAILLINPECRAIYAIYEPDVEGAKPAKRELFKTFDDTIAKDDIVMVPSNTRHNVTTVKVVEIDVEWDVNVSTEVRWIIGKVDQKNYRDLKEQEAAAISAIKESEKTHARNELKKKMFAHMNPDEVAKLAIAGPKPDVSGLAAPPAMPDPQF